MEREVLREHDHKTFRKFDPTSMRIWTQLPWQTEPVLLADVTKRPWWHRHPKPPDRNIRDLRWVVEFETGLDGKSFAKSPEECRREFGKAEHPAEPGLGVGDASDVPQVKSEQIAAPVGLHSPANGILQSSVTENSPQTMHPTPETPTERRYAIFDVADRLSARIFRSFGRFG
jgi:hypothetical protein